MATPVDPIAAETDYKVNTTGLIVPISSNLMDDSSFMLGSYLMRGIDLARRRWDSQYIHTGDGGDVQPHGVFNNMLEEAGTLTDKNRREQVTFIKSDAAGVFDLDDAHDIYWGLHSMARPNAVVSTSSALFGALDKESRTDARIPLQDATGESFHMKRVYLWDGPGIGSASTSGDNVFVIGDFMNGYLKVERAG